MAMLVIGADYALFFSLQPKPAKEMPMA